MDTFSKILGGMDGATAWGWDSMFLAMKKVRIAASWPHLSASFIVTANTLLVTPFALNL